MTSKLFTDDQVAAAILGVLRTAKKWVVLVSPYLDLEKWDHAMQAIELAIKRGVDLRLYVRAQNETDSFVSNVEWLSSVGVKVHGVLNLHAKIYANESVTILSSMNLTSYSANNSREFAIQVEDSVARELLNYIKSLDADSEKLSRTAAPAKSKAPLPKPYATNKSKTAQKPGRPEMLIREAASLFKASNPGGNCIRCARPIDPDIDRPLCRDCYQVWSQYSNPEYEETYCLACGKEKRGISYAKPVCRSCYKRAV